jgi:hypothetical protein
MNLTKYENDGLELFINTDTGTCFASIRAVARMCEKSISTIHKFVSGGLKTVHQMELISAEITTNTGIKTVHLLNEEQILEVVTRYHPKLIKAFVKAGLRVYLHQLAGFKVTSEAVNQKQEKQANNDKLPCEEEAERVSNSIRNITDNLYDNPIVAQISIDYTIISKEI